MGHANIKTTESYLGSLENEQKRNISRMLIPKTLVKDHLTTKTKSSDMYWILGDGDSKFIWDELKEVMYEVTEDVALRIPPSIELLAKFRPTLELIEKT